MTIDLRHLPEGLAKRLRAAAEVDATRLGTQEDGTPTWTRFRRPRPLTDAGCTDDGLRAAREAAETNRPLLLLGVGEGARLVSILEHTTARVLAWDPDPALLRRLLAAHPLGPHLESGRLELLLGVDLAHHQDAHQSVVLEHPTFQAAYAYGRSLVHAHKPLALLVQGELFIDDVAHALTAHGWRVLRWDLEHLPPEEHAHILATSGAQVAVAINTHEHLAEPLTAAGIPLAVWEIDPNTSGPAVLRAPCPHTHAFTYRAVNVRPLQQAGYRHVHTLPLAAPIHRLRPGRPDPDYTVPIAFVGASMAESAQAMQAELAGLVAGDRAVLAALQAVLQLQRADLSRWRLPQILDSRLPGLRTRIQRTHGVDIATVLGETVAAEKRLTWLSHLGPLGLHVWGDAGWQLAQAHGVTWRGWADHFTELPAIYHSAAIHVDVPRLYQQDAVAMRVFDVMAAGGFLIAEHGTELCALFEPGVELETYRTPTELVHKCRFYLEQPQLRARIAAAGQARVHRDHSIHTRVGHILHTLGLPSRHPATEHLGASSPAP